MKRAAIISSGEALQILKNDLRKAALEKRAAELASATAEDRPRIIDQVDGEIEKELRRRKWWLTPAWVIH